MTRRPKGSAALIVLGVLGATMLGLSTPETPIWNDLNPDWPASYLEVGERLVVLAGDDPEALRVARQTLALGVALAADEGNAQDAAGCCIALAETLGDDPAAQKDLWDLALILDPTRITAWARHRPGEALSSRRLQAAECVRLARNASYDDAEELLSRPQVRETIAAVAEELGFDADSIVQALEGMIVDQGSDPCRGKVFVSTIVDGESVRDVCDQHAYPIATAPSRDLLVRLLSIESACLDAGSLSDEWGGVASMGRAGPAREPSIEWVLERFCADPSRPIRAQGGWGARP